MLDTTSIMCYNNIEERDKERLIKMYEYEYYDRVTRERGNYICGLSWEDALQRVGLTDRARAKEIVMLIEDYID